MYLIYYIGRVPKLLVLLGKGGGSVGRCLNTLMTAFKWEMERQRNDGNGNNVIVLRGGSRDTEDEDDASGSRRSIPILLSALVDDRLECARFPVRLLVWLDRTRRVVEKFGRRPLNTIHSQTTVPASAHARTGAPEMFLTREGQVSSHTELLCAVVFTHRNKHEKQYK